MFLCLVVYHQVGIKQRYLARGSGAISFWRVEKNWASQVGPCVGHYFYRRVKKDFRNSFSWNLDKIRSFSSDACLVTDGWYCRRVSSKRVNISWTPLAHLSIVSVLLLLRTILLLSLYASNTAIGNAVDNRSNPSVDTSTRSLAGWNTFRQVKQQRLYSNTSQFDYRIRGCPEKSDISRLSCYWRYGKRQKNLPAPGSRTRNSSGPYGKSHPRGMLPLHQAG